MDRSAALERELAECGRLKAELVKQLEAYRDLDSYVRNVNRFSLYTRTRMDYERGVMRLTSEQEEAVAEARPGRDFLIRGGAGTGKTIVLLHAFGAAVRTRKAELALHSNAPILFLTYTRTLVKFDRYVAEILREAEAGAAILTTDAYFQDRLRLLGRQQRIDYAVIGQLAARLNTTGFFTPAELAVEIEDFIFANMVTRREYIEERIPRKGMRTPLSAGQREAVWGIRDRIVELMEHDGILSRNYSRSVLIDHLGASPGDAGTGELDIAFVDESQDLTAADLRALKLMSRRGLVMAGDTGQSIYGVSSPYKRAGVDIAGRTRVLHTSFRNTMPIQEIADAYRALSGLEEDEGAEARAFRDGPAPELYTAGTRTELLSLLLRKTALFIDSLGYDPENITILAPTKTDLATIGDSLGHAGYRYANIRDEEFSFKETSTIRLSTLHSSKGLDFAVVLLYLPALPPRGEYADRAAQLIVRNLLYVAMTRAMDNLNVFTLEGAHDGQQEEPLQDLVRVFRRYRQQRLSSPPG
jgi:DNA helicase IV